MEWILENKEWIFSGLGVAVLSSIILLFKKKRDSINQTQKSGDNSLNYQAGRDLNIDVTNKGSSRSKELGSKRVYKVDEATGTRSVDSEEL